MGEVVTWLFYISVLSQKGVSTDVTYIDHELVFKGFRLEGEFKLSGDKEELIFDNIYTVKHDTSSKKRIYKIPPGVKEDDRLDCEGGEGECGDHDKDKNEESKGNDDSDKADAQGDRTLLTTNMPVAQALGGGGKKMQSGL